MELAYLLNTRFRTKLGTKCLERSARYREEGNKLFQSDQAMQSILFYNKALAYAPHPTFEEFHSRPDNDFSVRQDPAAAVSTAASKPGKLTATGKLVKHHLISWFNHFKAPLSSVAPPPPSTSPLPCATPTVPRPSGSCPSSRTASGTSPGRPSSGIPGRTSTSCGRGRESVTRA